MKRFFLLILGIAGLLAIAQSNSKADSFSITFGNEPGYWGPYYNSGYYYPDEGYYYYHRRAYYRPYYYHHYYYGRYYRRHHRHYWHD
jgi:hypothetical protein